MKADKVQAKDIPDERVIELIRECNEARCDYSDVHEPGYHGGRPGYAQATLENPGVIGHWANRLDLGKKLDVPEKVLLAKMKRLVGRGLVNGCACGCRGDFTVTTFRDAIGTDKPFPVETVVKERTVGMTWVSPGFYDRKLGRFLDSLDELAAETRRACGVEGTWINPLLASFPTRPDIGLIFGDDIEWEPEVIFRPPRKLW